MENLPAQNAYRSVSNSLEAVGPGPVDGKWPSRADSVLSAVTHGVFIVSGMAALLYQMIWQRSLLVLYGSNTESVAMVVAAFLVGLGCGGLVGGILSRQKTIPLVAAFAILEVLIGSYGLVSLRLFHWVGDLTLNAGILETGLLAFGLVLFPTVMMGATLPLLVTYRVKAIGHVGRSVSWLYFVNTLGAALGAFLAPTVFLRHLGLAGSVEAAALLNLFSASAMFGCWRWRAHSKS